MSEQHTYDYQEPERPPLGPAYLEVVRGASSTGVLQIDQFIILGRDDVCEGRFAVAGVSRQHAKVARDGDGTMRLFDLGSRNGTFLNGRRIDVAVLREGDEIRIGPVVLRLRYVGDEGKAKGDPALEQLSERELQVAQLVAEGLTNGEIADRLSISPGTVGRHLANIYKRLGIHSRAALTRLVASGG